LKKYINIAVIAENAKNGELAYIINFFIGCKNPEKSEKI